MPIWADIFFFLNFLNPFTAVAKSGGLFIYLLYLSFFPPYYLYIYACTWYLLIQSYVLFRKLYFMYLLTPWFN